MTIEFNCPYCGKLLRTHDAKAGLPAKCPGCAAEVVIPATSGPADEYGLAEGAGAGAADQNQGGAAGGGLRACPICGEMIRQAATRCRFCGEELRAPPRAATRSRPSRAGAPSQNSQLAIVSLVLGIISIPFFCCVCLVPVPIAAIVCGFIALGKYNEGTGGGKGMAIAGIICGFAGIALAILWIILNASGVLGPNEFQKF